MKKEVLAAIVGNITGDGHLQCDGKRGIIFFYSKQYKKVDKFKKCFENMFKLNGRIRRPIYTGKAYTSRYYVCFSSKKVAEFLKSIGTPVGNKTNSVFLVPDWIRNGTKNVRKAYLKALFDCEACIYVTRIYNNKRWRITIEQYKSSILEDNGIMYLDQIRDMLENFGIHTSPIRTGKMNIRKDGSISICHRFDIEKKHFISFYRNINFGDKNKKLKLLKALQAEV